MNGFFVGFYFKKHLNSGIKINQFRFLTINSNLRPFTIIFFLLQKGNLKNAFFY